MNAELGIPNHPLGGLSLELYLLMMVVLLVFFAFYYRRKSVAAKHRRADFIQGFHPSELRTHVTDKSVIFKVLEQTPEGVRVLPIWRHGTLNKNAATLLVPEDQLMPFDEAAFINGIF
ncbi:MAG: hypothetical protein ACU0A6_05425 [Shimia sp.]|jgi:hypothetical protein|uniref:hypothetical protein n=1 Tax=Shimia sp. TaxID=1954381 RepID=UPI004058B846